MTQYDPFDISDEAIRLRSYTIWIAEGRPHGADVAHWLRAEAELVSEMRAALSATRPTAFVAPRVPISTPPCRSIAGRLYLRRSDRLVTVAMR